MVEYKNTQLDQIFAALGDSTRRAIIQQLLDGKTKVTEIANAYTMSLNAVSKHIKVLEKAGLVSRQIQGREHFVALEQQSLQQATIWLDEIERFWSERLNALEHYLNKENEELPNE